MLDTKKFTIDGVDYEINTGIDVLNREVRHVIVEEKSGEQQMIKDGERIPAGWKLEGASKSDGIDYVPSLLGEAKDLFDEYGKGAELDGSQQPTGKQRSIGYIDPSEIRNNGSETPEKGFFLTARKGGKLIGVMDVYMMGTRNERGRLRGKFNKTTVAPEFRGIGVAKNLKLSAIAILINKSGCGSIVTHPATDAGEKFNRRNGFSPIKENPTYYELSEKIIDQVRELVDKKDEKGNKVETKFSDFPKLLEEMRPIFKREVGESEFLASRESHL